MVKKKVEVNANLCVWVLFALFILLCVLYMSLNARMVLLSMLGAWYEKHKMHNTIKAVLKTTCIKRPLLFKDHYYGVAIYQIQCI